MSSAGQFMLERFGFRQTGFYRQLQYCCRLDRSRVRHSSLHDSAVEGLVCRLFDVLHSNGDVVDHLTSQLSGKFSR